MDTLLILLFGALGGAARGLVGFAKYYTSYKNVSFSWIYFAITIGISAMVGLGATWTLHSSGITFEGINLNPAVASCSAMVVAMLSRTSIKSWSSNRSLDRSAQF
jgi:hypothetical protein